MYVLKDVVLGEEMPSFANTEIEHEYHLRIDKLRRRQDAQPGA